MAAAKAAGRPEAEWMTFAPASVRQAEQRFKDALASADAPLVWDAVHPRPAHETRGGPLADRAQRAVPFLDGLSLNQAKDKVLQLMFGYVSVERTRRVDDDSSDEEVVRGAAAAVTL